MQKLDIPQGTMRLTALSHDEFRVNPGSLFPSLYRLEQDGKLKAEWRPTENNRRERWNRVSFAVASVLEGA